MQQGRFDLLIAGEEREDKGTFGRKQARVRITRLTFVGDFPGLFRCSSTVER